MITSSRHGAMAVKALRDLRLDVSTLLSRLPAAIYTTDAAGRITFYNEAAVDLWGRRPKIGEDHWCGSWKLFWPDGTPMQHDECPMAVALRENRKVSGGEAIAERPDGTRVPFLAFPTPLTDEVGTVIGALNMLVDITAQKEHENRIRMLMREVNHRVMNHYQVILAMIRETNERVKSPAEFEQRIRDRIQALASSQQLLVSSNWQGATLSDLVMAQIKPFGAENSIVVSGPNILLQPNAVQYLGIAFHELATNSAKYGVFSADHGNVEVRWDVERDDEGNDRFVLTWRETDGPEVVAAYEPGFGRTVLEKATPLSLGGEAKIDYGTQSVSWNLRAPLKHVQAAANAEQSTSSAL